jgi:hypothetical protein
MASLSPVAFLSEKFGLERGQRRDNLLYKTTSAWSLRCKNALMCQIKADGVYGPS